MYGLSGTGHSVCSLAQSWWFLLLICHALVCTNSLSHESRSEAQGRQSLPAEQLQADSFIHSHRRIPKSADRGDEVRKALQHVQQDVTSVCAHKNRSVVLDISLDNSRWKSEALLAVEVANLLTSLWRIKAPDGRSLAENDTLLYKLVRSNLLFLPSVFGSVICFERNQYRDFERFCPYAYRDQKLDRNIHVIDLSVEIDYLTSNETIWWREPRKKALNLTPEKITEFYSVRLNASTAEQRKNHSTPVVRYKDGFWTRPYFDCFGGKIWMVTYLAPFFDETDNFLGVVSIDIELSDVDINQCDGNTSARGSGDSEGSDKTGKTDEGKLMEFLGTHRCKKSTLCEAIPNQGFKRGSYLCKCKPGYYFPNPKAAIKKFNGSVIEADHDSALHNKPNRDDFECLKCSKGCTVCDSDRPCVYTGQDVLWTFLLVFNGCTIVLSIVFGIVVYIHRENKIFHSASVLFLELALVGAVLMFTAFVLYFLDQSDEMCISRLWLFQCGFVLVYSSLALKTWRLKSSFRARSPRRVEVTEVMMVRRLVVIFTLFFIYLLIWTLTAPPHIVSVMTTDKLAYKHCSTDSVWNYVIIAGDLLLLMYGMYLCFRTRNAPSAYNESKFVTLAIYNAMFVRIFIAVLRFLTANSSNSDIVLAADFILIQMNASAMLLLVFLPKFYCLWKLRSRGVNKALTLSRRGSLTNTTNGSYVNDVHTMEKENDDLKAEVQRLATKVALLQSKLMKDRNKHLKSNSSQRTCAAYSNANDEREMSRPPASPVTRLME